MNSQQASAGRQSELPKSSEPLESFVSNLPDFQFVSPGIFELVQDLHREDISTRDIATKISRDPNLSARVLRLANSAYFGAAQQVATVNQAVGLLGLDQVRGVVQSLWLQDSSPHHGGISKVFGVMKFAAHSIAVSYLSGRITRLFRFQAVGMGEALTAGVLHDIGICLLGSGDRKAYQQSQAAYWNRLEEAIKAPESSTLLEIEQETLGFTHAELGGWLALKWNLPPAIQEALGSHHGSIETCVNKEMAVIVQLSELLCNRLGLDYLPAGMAGTVDQSVIDFVATQHKTLLLEWLAEELAEDIEKARSLHAMVLNAGEPSQEKPRTVPVSGPQSRLAATGHTPVAPSKVPGLPVWSYILPGLPQILTGQTNMGAVLLVIFVLSLVLFGVSAATGGIVTTAAGLFVAATVWVLSILFV